MKKALDQARILFRRRDMEKIPFALKPSVFLVMFAAATLTLGCGKTLRRYSDAEMEAASQALESITTGYVAKKDCADIDRLIDNLRIVASGTNVSKNAVMPMLGFFHAVLSENPEAASRWLGREREFRGTVFEGILSAAKNLDEESVLADASPAMLDYCWGAYYATANTNYAHKVISVALKEVPRSAMDMSQMAAAWSVHSMALKHPAVAQCLNDALRNANDEAASRVGVLFDEEERQSCFDAGVRMRLGLVCPVQHREKPPVLKGRWQGLDKADAWIDNVRTNRSIETCGTFRDRRFIPFFVGEVIPAGETNEEVRVLAAAVARYMHDSQKMVHSAPNVRQAQSLLEKGCKLPFVRWAASPAIHADRLAKLEDILTDCEKDADCCAVRMLVLHSIWLFRRTGTNRRRLLDSVVAWANARNLLDNRAYCASILIGFATDARDLADVAEQIRAVGKTDPWLPTILEAVAETDAAWKSRGNGWASTVTDEGWKGYDEHLRKAHRLFSEARTMHPDYTIGSASQARSHGGELPWLDALFSEITEHRLDEYALYGNYIFFGLFPRWCGSIGMMDRFADICYETGRHDTMITAHYATLQFEIASEKQISLEEHFSDERRLSRLLEVCSAQMTNRNAYTYVRDKAFFMRAVALGRRHRYDQIGDYASEKAHRVKPESPICVAKAAAEDDLVLSGLTGPHQGYMVAAHDLYLAKRWDDFLATARTLQQRTDLTEWEKRYLRVFSQSARGFAKHDQPVDIVADMSDSNEFQSRTPYWIIAKKACHWAGRSNANMCPLYWSIPLPPESTLSFSLAKIHDKAVFWMRVGQMYKDEYSRHRPDVLICNEGGKIGIAVVDRDTSLVEAKPSMAWQPCPQGRFPVKVAWAENVVKVWIGNEGQPCVTETRFADALSSTRQFSVYYSFRGCNIRLSDIKATVD